MVSLEFFMMTPVAMAINRFYLKTKLVAADIVALLPPLNFETKLTIYLGTYALA